MRSCRRLPRLKLRGGINSAVERNLGAFSTCASLRPRRARRPQTRRPNSEPKPSRGASGGETATGAERAEKKVVGSSGAEEADATQEPTESWKVAEAES